jgi:hypothetical protein
MDEENKAIGFLIICVLIGSFWFVSSIDLGGIVLILFGAVMFFGAMLVAGENSDFDAIHNEW